jgi:flavin reductase (DIM6/NTAB) family NADH-FMN oxidoreductase RutF
MNTELKTPLELAADPSPNMFRAAMRNLAGGVTVVSTGQGNARAGLTATSVSSLSIDPPSLLVCIGRASTTLSALAANRAFGVNVLAAHHREVAERFSGRGGVCGAQRYAGSDWMTLVTGAPILADALTAIDCTLEELIEWHSHAIVVGRVRSVHVNGGTSPLVYWQGNYGNVSGSGG